MHPKEDHLLTPNELERLTCRVNALAAWHLSLRIFIHVVLGWLGYSLLYTGEILLGFLVLIPHFMAASFLGWAGIGHELFHNSVFPSKKINRFFFVLFSILTWNNYRYFDVSHPYHHRNTLEPGDTEGISQSPVRLLEIVFWLTFDARAFSRRIKILLSNALGEIPESSDAARLFPIGSEARRALFCGARMVLLVQCSLALLFVFSSQYWLLLIVNTAPFFLTFLNRTLATMQHFGLRTGEQKRDYFTSCRTVLLNPLLAFLYANMNYHVEHHFYPGIPYYHLNTVHDILVRRHIYPNIETNYWIALRGLVGMGAFSR